jgi:hypothetical protein
MAASRPQILSTPEFQWQFVVADVTHPLIGDDFISHFGQQVDWQQNRLLDEVMSFSVPS